MKVGLIGLGRLGGSLQNALQKTVGVDVVTGPEAERAELIFLCVPDGVIAGVASQLEAPRESVVAHCSGALPASILKVAPAAAGSFHPLQTFPDPDTGAERFLNCPVFIEGEPAALERLEALADRLGAVAHRLSPEAKVRYHTAAVMACNQLCALLDAAFDVASDAGVEDPNVYLPLVRATLDHIEAMGTTAALTGPVARGDTETIAHHLDALDAHPDIREIYRLLSLRALDMTDHTMATNERVQSLLKKPPSG